MNVFTKLKENDHGTSLQFEFDIENDDKLESISFNSGKNKIYLGSNKCSFEFPFIFKLPHPDLLAMAALKIISPYIGSRFITEYPISKKFANAILNQYKHIKKLNYSEDIKERITPIKENYCVSFSGGADSLAVANICPDGTPLILSARKFHPDIGKFESWYNTDGNVKTLDNMSDKYQKICVYSDFEFLSTNKHYCIYPDNYAFTIPSILLADHLKLTGIFTGDIFGAFTGDETKPFNMTNFNKLKKYYNSVSLDFDAPVKGLSEIGTEKINTIYENSEISSTCQYGKFKNPCNKCVKCFRKTFIKSYVSNKIIKKELLYKLNESESVKKIANEKPDKIHLPLTLNEILKDYDLSKYNNLNTIKEKVSKEFDTSFLNELYIKPYDTFNSKTMLYCLENLKKFFSATTHIPSRAFSGQ